MKRLLTLLLTVLLFATIFLTACEKDVVFLNIDPAVITADIIANGEFPEMTERRLDRLEERYYGIDLEGIVDVSHYFSPAGANPDIITVVKTESPAVAVELKAFFEDWLQTEIDGTLGNYHPAQQQKVENLIVETKGDYVAVFLCADSGKASEIFNNFFA